MKHIKVSDSASFCKCGPNYSREPHMLFCRCLCGRQRKQDYWKTECECSMWVSVFVAEKNGNYCARDREPDIYAHICDLGLWWLLAKEKERETLIVMLMLQMAQNRKSMTALLRIIMQGYCWEQIPFWVPQAENKLSVVTLVNSPDSYSCHLLFLITVAYEGARLICSSIDALLISTLCHGIRWE